ncbi:unnamed protein product [Cochlearia groenlandica]
MHAAWRNGLYMIGDAWIIYDSSLLIIWSDNAQVIEAINHSSNWSTYRSLLHKISSATTSFSSSCLFFASSVSANMVVRDVAKNVSRCDLFQSYLAMEGPD